MAILEISARFKDAALDDRELLKLILFIERLVEKHNLDVDLPDNANPPKERMAELLDSINESSSQLMEAVVSTDVDELIQEYEAATTTQRAFGYAKLDKSEKTSIHQHLKKIREIIEKSALDDRKKNALFERIK